MRRFFDDFPQRLPLLGVRVLTVAERRKSPFVAEYGFSVCVALNDFVRRSVLSEGARIASPC